MKLDRDWIAARIPHQGSMCLLDAVTEWSEAAIRCTAASHRSPTNPLQAEGRLGAACGIEYAAQAMAIHGALLGAPDSRPRRGFLASVRNVDFWVERLDDVADDLDVVAERFAGDDNNVLYQFSVRAGDRLLLAGRAAVVLNGESL